MTQIANSSVGHSLPKVEINKENVQNTIAKSSQVVSDSFESNSAVKTSYIFLKMMQGLSWWHSG